MVNQSFSPVSAQRWQDIKAMLVEKAGITIGSDEGSTAELQGQNTHGVSFSWCWDGAALALTIIKTSFADHMVGEDEAKVMSQFAAWIAGVQ
jgi:hypothetical protein